MQVNRRSALESAAAGLVSMFSGDAPEQGCWLDKYSSQQILAAVKTAGIMTPFRRELQRMARQQRAAHKRETRAENVVLWRGTVSESLPDHPWREVMASRREMRRGHTTDRVAWMGVILPAGTVILVDSRIPVDSRTTVVSAIHGAKGEIIQTPKGVRVHIWRNPKVSDTPLNVDYPIEAEYFDPSAMDLDA